MFEALTLRQGEIDQRSQTLCTSIRMLSDDERRAFYRDWEPRIKDPDTYAALNWFFLAGLHHMYLGQWIQGGADLAMMLIGLGLLPVHFWAGVAMLALVTLLELPALFRSRIIVQAYNIQRGEWALRALPSAAMTTARTMPS